MKLEDIQKKYDSLNMYRIFDISTELSNLNEAEKNRFETQSEMKAMSFQDNTGLKCWKTYFGPLTTWKNEKSGEEVFMPDKNCITQKDIKYWTERAKITRSPILIFRYTGLVWDFSKEVTGVGPDYKTIILPNIEASIVIVKKNLVEHPLTGITIIKQGIKRALSINHKTLALKCMSTLVSYAHKYEGNDQFYIYSSPFEVLINNIEIFKKYEEQILTENVERFNILEKKCQESFQKTDRYVHILINECKLLCKYYKKKDNIQKIKIYIERSLECTKLCFKLRGGMWSIDMLHRFQIIYKTYNLYEEANKLYILIQKYGRLALDEMKSNYISIPYDRKEVDKVFQYLLQGDTKEVLYKYIVTYIPKVKREQEIQKREEEQNALYNIIPTVALDWSGMPINYIGIGKDAKRKKLIYGMYNRMLFNANFIYLHIKYMKEKQIYTYDNVIAIIKELPFIREEQLPIIIQGFKSYFEGNYIISCTLLTNQFEAAIRNIAVMTGHEILRPNKDSQEGNEYVSLEGLLNELQSDEQEEDDVITYFKTLFTDKCGWNLRNLICHGLLQASSFNQTMADRIVHAFMTLSLIKIVPRK